MSKIEELQVKLGQCTDPKAYDKIKTEIAAAERQSVLDENRRRLDEEAARVAARQKQVERMESLLQSVRDANTQADTLDREAFERLDAFLKAFDARKQLNEKAKVALHMAKGLAEQLGLDLPTLNVEPVPMDGEMKVWIERYTDHAHMLKRAGERLAEIEEDEILASDPKVDFETFIVHPNQTDYGRLVRARAGQERQPAEQGEPEEGASDGE